MVTEKTGLSLHQQWHHQQQGKIGFSYQEKRATLRRRNKHATHQSAFPAETLLSIYSRFSFHLLRRAIKAGLLIVREELLWLARER